MGSLGFDAVDDDDDDDDDDGCGSDGGGVCGCSLAAMDACEGMAAMRLGGGGDDDDDAAAGGGLEVPLVD